MEGCAVLFREDVSMEGIDGIGTRDEGDTSTHYKLFPCSHIRDRGRFLA